MVNNLIHSHCCKHEVIPARKKSGGQNESKEKISESNTNKLAESFSGNGINQVSNLVSNNIACSFYIDNAPIYWSGEDYIRAIHLRTNLLQCKSIPVEKI